MTTESAPRQPEAEEIERMVSAASLRRNRIVLTARAKLLAAGLLPRTIDERLAKGEYTFSDLCDIVDPERHLENPEPGEQAEQAPREVRPSSERVRALTGG